MPMDSIFLLSHFHTDHYEGLTSKHSLWCTELTGQLVRIKYNCKIHPLYYR